MISAMSRSVTWRGRSETLPQIAASSMTRRGSRPGTARRPPTTGNPAARSVKESAMAGISTGPMAGQTVLVTGGTSGIGKATAADLAAMGARVGITGRDIARARTAAADVAAASGNPAVDPFPADMSSQAEVRRLADEVLASYPRLDVLVNNVCGIWATRRLTADGLER